MNDLFGDKEVIHLRKENRDLKQELDMARRALQVTNDRIIKVNTFLMDHGITIKDEEF